MKRDRIVGWHKRFARYKVDVRAFDYRPTTVAARLVVGNWGLTLIADDDNECTQYVARRRGVDFANALTITGNNFTHEVTGNNPWLLDRIIERLRALD